jgi:hypothetical protein
MAPDCGLRTAGTGRRGSSAGSAQSGKSPIDRGKLRTEFRRTRFGTKSRVPINVKLRQYDLRVFDTSLVKTERV